MKLTSVSARLWLILGLVFAGMLAVVYFSLQQNRQIIERHYRDNTRHVVEIAESVLQHFYQLQQTGAISQQQAQQQALAVISAIRFDQDNYIFVGDEAGVSLSNGIRELVGTNIMGIQDPSGKPLVRELYRKASEGGGFVDYQWPDLANKDVLLPKASYADYFAPWRWTLGSGVNTGALQQQLITMERTSLINVLVLILLVSGLALFFVRRVNRQSRELIRRMQALADGHGDLRERLPLTGGKEVADICASYNQLAASLEDMVLQVEREGARFQASARPMLPDAPLMPHSPVPTLNNARTVLRRMSGYAESLQQSHARLKAMAEQDPMTGLLSSQAFEAQVREQLATQDANTPGALVLVGFDDPQIAQQPVFAGPVTTVAGVLKHHLSESVPACLIPDKGFAYWMRDTDAADSMRLALLLQQQLSQALSPAQEVSLGMSAALGRSKSYELLFSEAERALMRAQRDGGGRVYEY